MTCNFIFPTLPRLQGDDSDPDLAGISSAADDEKHADGDDDDKKFGRKETNGSMSSLFDPEFHGELFGVGCTHKGVH